MQGFGSPGYLSPGWPVGVCGGLEVWSIGSMWRGDVRAGVVRGVEISEDSGDDFVNCEHYAFLFGRTSTVIVQYSGLPRIHNGQKMAQLCDTITNTQDCVSRDMWRGD